MNRVVIRGAEVDGRLVDVAWSGGAVDAVESRGGLRLEADDEVIEAAGGALVPGLHDHHVHVAALAAARRSVEVGPPSVDSAAGLRAALVDACIDAVPGEWVRAVGYHESVAGPLDAGVLDALDPAVAAVPLRVQHRSGQMWALNREAIRRTGIDELDDPGVERSPDGAATGRVFGLDDVLRARLPAAPPDVPAVAFDLARYGVTGVTDCTPTDDAADVKLLATAVTTPGFPVRITVTGGPGLATTAAPSLTRGPVKILPSERALADVDGVIDQFAAARATGRPIAVHCVSRAGLVVALAAWDAVGARSGDRVEHGGVVPDDLIDRLRSLGLTVVTQPNLVAERGDQYLADVEPVDVPHLWRCRSLIDAGVAVAAGTDAPYGHPDPWRAMAAAVERRTASGRVMGDGERVDARRALDLFLGAPESPTVVRRISEGARTDLCLLHGPLADVLRRPSADAVRLTVGIGGVTSSR